jgi:hypothetical protein
VPVALSQGSCAEYVTEPSLPSTAVQVRERLRATCKAVAPLAVVIAMLQNIRSRQPWRSQATDLKIAPIRRECARSRWLPRSLSVLSTVGLNAYLSGLNCSVAPRQKLQTAGSCSARHGFPQQGQF